MSNYLIFIDKFIIIADFLLYKLCKLHSLGIYKLKVCIEREVLIYIMCISSGLRRKSKLEGQLACVIYSCKSVSDSLPIGNAIEGKQMCIIKPGDLIGIGLPEVVVEVGADELITKERGDVHRAVIAHFVTRVPTIADSRRRAELCNDLFKIFDALDVLECDLDTKLFRLADNAGCPASL